MRYRDPDCTCEIEYPGGYRRWCQNCRLIGPLPGSLADPDWERKQNDPAVLREAADRLASRIPPVTAGPYTEDERRTMEQVSALRRTADELDD